VGDEAAGTAKRERRGPALNEQDALLTLQEAADRLKVHYMTAYRWVRAGDLPAFKTGGRLRLRVADVNAFLQQRTVDAALPQQRVGRTDWSLHLDRLFDLLLAGNEGEATNLVRRVVADGASAGETYVRLLAPAMHRIGDAWAAGEITVPVEHRASEIANAIIARMGEYFRRRGPARGVAVTLTPPGEQHGLAAAMLAHFLRGGGYEVHHLGPNVPLGDLRLFLEMVPSDVVAVSITTGVDPRLYHRIVEIVEQSPAPAHGPPLVVFGGQGVDRTVAGGAGGVAVDDLTGLLDVIDDATGRRPGRANGRAPDDGGSA
jgi:MerR family transcriptional regulator, light-induced transcriptional regulator